MPTPPKNLNEISALAQLMKDLRGPEGCPWDKEQDHLSLAPYAIEEVFEMVEALELKNDKDICEELGDVLFQVVLHAELASERQAFTLSEVIRTISEKIVRRHPHVFANVKVANTDEVIQNWDQIKAQEKAGKIKPVFSMPKGLPAVPTAQKIGEKTEKLQFDWIKSHEVLVQLKSEIAELEQAMSTGQGLEHEIGDVLFSTVQLARHLKIDAETALRRTNLRFQKRFNFMVAACDNDLEKFILLSAENKESLWKSAKSKD